MRTFIALLLALGFVFSNKASAANAEDDIRDLLTSQTDAWNRGDLKAFVQPYAEDCTFVGKTITKGRKEVLARYKTLYPTTAAMGNFLSATWKCARQANTLRSSPANGIWKDPSPPVEPKAACLAW